MAFIKTKPSTSNKTNNKHNDLDIAYKNQKNE